jgi:hypothetical protein
MRLHGGQVQVHVKNEDNIEKNIGETNDENEIQSISSDREMFNE